MRKSTIFMPSSSSCFGEEFLGIVGTVERLAARIGAGAGVVAADDQVGAAVVLADDGVPDGFAGPPIRIASGSRARAAVLCG